jgi:hypothetical protein
MVRLRALSEGPALSLFELVIDGRCATEELIASLPRQAQRRFRKIFRLLAESGRAGREDASFKHLESSVWEMKEHSANVRLFCFRHQHRVIVCTHGDSKPGGNARYRREIEKVLRLHERCRIEGVLP